ncbi:MAG: hypothetical protein K0S47_4561 [Herbinix sp.]|jgi:hypothetical protein|nr:hypothetical protein [Herbinix sp.]
MKLKYKKAILLTTMSTLGIGMLTLSISRDNANLTKAQDRIEEVSSEEVGLLSSDETQSYKISALTDEITGDPSGTPAPTVSPTAMPSPTPLPVYDLEKDTNIDIAKLFNDYYTAKKSADIEKIKSIMSDPTNVESAEQLQNETEYIEDYRDITCYYKKSIEDGSYIVYVYYEVKFTGVNTTAPGLTKSYVVTDNEGKLKIFSGEMDEDLAAYFAERNNDPDVVEIINMTNENGEQAREKDEDLASFWKAIDNIGKESNEEDAGE